MGCCIRAPSRISPDRADKKAKRPVPPRVPRVNGWSPPLHPFQIMAWAMFLTLAVATFLIFIPLLPHVWKVTANSVTGVCFLLYFIVHLVAISIDPAESTVRHKNYHRQAPPSFDRSQHTHVIHNRFCCLCQVPVGPKTKHCSACNKCVAGFDHHCKWLNNCIGERNYWFFLGSVALALAGLLCVTVILTCVFIQYFVSPTWLRTDPSFSAVTDVKTWLLFLPFAPVKTAGPVVLGVGVLVALLTVSALVVLGHLFIFHLYLMSNGLSTLEYIIRGHKQQESKDQPPVKNPSSETELPQELNDNCSSSAPRKVPSSNIASKAVPDVDSVSITICPEDSPPAELNDNCSSSASQSAPTRENSPVEMIPIDTISLSTYSEDSPPAVLTNNFISPAPWSVPSRENSPVEMIRIDTVSTTMSSEDLPPAVLKDNFTSPAPWSVPSRENSPVEMIRIDTVSTTMSSEDLPPAVLTDNFMSPAPWSVPSRENSPVEMTPIDAISITMYSKDLPPAVLKDNFISPWSVPSRENSPVEMTPIDAISITMYSKDSPPAVLTDNFTSPAPWSVPSRENSPVEMTPIDAISITMYSKDSPPAVLKDNFTSPAPWSVPSRENSPVEMTPIDAISITMCSEKSPPAVLTDNFTSPAPWSVPSRENSPVEMTPIDVIGVIYPEDSPPAVLTDFLSPPPCPLLSRNPSLIALSAIDGISITTSSEDSAPAETDGGLTLPTPGAMHTVFQPLSRTSSSSSIMSIIPQSASPTMVARDQQEEMKWPTYGDRAKNEGLAFGAQANWLQRGPEPAGYRPGPSLQRGRIRPPTPTPGPWRVRLNSREAQRLATTTVFLEEEEEDAQEAGRRRPAQPPKEVFLCWGEPSGRAGLPIAQGRARAKQCSAHSTQFSCASVDSVEPADGSLQASAECPKPDQSDLWEGRDL